MAVKVPDKLKKEHRKKGVKKPTKVLDIHEWNPEKGLSPYEELFCRYFVLNDETRNNAMWAYSMAYGYKLEDQTREDAVYDTDELGHKKCVVPSTYDRVANTCSSAASRLLRDEHIGRRCRELLNTILSDDVVDAQLAKVILQDVEYPSKVAGIREYNKLRARITDQVKHTFAGDPTTEEDIDAAIAAADAFFKKKKLPAKKK